jgi:hypothetical protein
MKTDTQTEQPFLADKVTMPREHYEQLRAKSAQADKLAEALRLTLTHVEELGMDGNELTDASNAMREALAEYEAAQGKS